MLESGASSPMPQYQCHKKVWALKILDIIFAPKPTIAELDKILNSGSDGAGVDSGHNAILSVSDGFASITVDADYLRRHKPVVGGYYITYEDGYTSFSPAKAFEEGYTRIGAA